VAVKEVDQPIIDFIGNCGTSGWAVSEARKVTLCLALH